MQCCWRCDDGGSSREERHPAVGPPHPLSICPRSPAGARCAESAPMCVRPPPAAATAANSSSNGGGGASAPFGGSAPRKPRAVVRPPGRRGAPDPLFGGGGVVSYRPRRERRRRRPGSTTGLDSAVRCLAPQAPRRHSVGASTWDRMPGPGPTSVVPPLVWEGRPAATFGCGGGSRGTTDGDHGAAWHRPSAEPLRQTLLGAPPTESRRGDDDDDTTGARSGSAQRSRVSLSKGPSMSRASFIQYPWCAVVGWLAFQAPSGRPPVGHRAPVRGRG